MLNETPVIPSDSVIKPVIHYKDDFSGQHFFMVLFPTGFTKSGEVRNQLVNFTEQNYKLEKLEVNQMVFDSERQMLLVKQFEKKEAGALFVSRLKTYRELQSSFPPGTLLFLVTPENFTSFYSLKDVEGYNKYHLEKY